MYVHIYPHICSPGGALKVTTHSPSLLLQDTWYLITCFQVLGTCLIATGTAPEHQITLHVEGILDPMAQPSILDSSKAVLPPAWEFHLAPCGVPGPAPLVPNTTRKCPGLQNSIQQPINKCNYNMKDKQYKYYVERFTLNVAKQIKHKRPLNITY